MSDLKFSCPNCSQHISCDGGYAGSQINCPTCQQSIIVPDSRPVSPPPIPNRQGGTNPAPPSVPSRSKAIPTVSVPVQTCGLAVASLICSCAGIFFSFLGTIPGIICGKMALKRIGRSSGLGGHGLARAGVITGYVVSALWLIPLGFILVAAILGGFQAASNVRQQKERMVEYDDAKLDANPDGSGWMLDLEDEASPNKPLTGRVHGAEFKPDEATLDHFGLKFEAIQSQIGLQIGFDRTDPAKLEKQILFIRKDASDTVLSKDGTSFKKPDIQIDWYDFAKKKSVSGFPKTYAMRVEFRGITNGFVSGHIHLCVLDDTKSFVRGNFVARVDGRFGPPTPGADRIPGRMAPPADTKPDAAGWTFDLENAVIPEAPVTGRIYGRPFQAQTVELEGPFLTFRQGVWPNDREFHMMLSEPESVQTGLAKPDDPARFNGLTINAKDGDKWPQCPSFSLRSSVPQDMMASSGNSDRYVMRLEFGEFKDGKMPGRIYLCTLDGRKSFIRGKFEARITKTLTGLPPNTQPPATTRPQGHRPGR